MDVTLTVNGVRRTVRDVDGAQTLLTLLREPLGLPGTKNACEQGECGSCSVYLDGVLVCSCLVLAGQAAGAEVVTVEGLASGGYGGSSPRDGTAPAVLHRVQQAFIDAGAVQCGFCTPGLVLAVTDLLARQPAPSEEDAREALAGNLCRCTGYQKILDAVRLASAAGTAKPG